MKYNQKKFLYESIMKSISKSVKKTLLESVDDEDFFSDLGYDTGKEVTFQVDDTIYPKNVKIIGTSISQKDIQNIEHIGTILSNDNGCWLLWNLNNEYWDPSNSKLNIIPKIFGENIAICIGKGLFAEINWSGLKTRYTWDNAAFKDSKISKMLKPNINGTGYDSTMNIINNYSEYIQDTIWEHLTVESTNEYQLYLPNNVELSNIYDNVADPKIYPNIYRLLNIFKAHYYSSSQYPGKEFFAYCVDFNNGAVNAQCKIYNAFSIALIHF